MAWVHEWFSLRWPRPISDFTHWNPFILRKCMESTFIPFFPMWLFGALLFEFVQRAEFLPLISGGSRPCHRGRLRLTVRSEAVHFFLPNLFYGFRPWELWCDENLSSTTKKSEIHDLEWWFCFSKSFFVCWHHLRYITTCDKFCIWPSSFFFLDSGTKPSSLWVGLPGFNLRKAGWILLTSWRCR